MKLKHFSIRDLLWLTLVIGLCLGWSIYRQRTYQRYYVEPVTRGEMDIVDREAGWKRRLVLLTDGAWHEDTGRNPPGELSFDVKKK